MDFKNICRGDVFLVDCGKVVGSEQGGIRPAVVIQNNIGNRHSQTTIVALVTSKPKKNLPTHVLIHKLIKPSYVLLEQIRTVSIKRLRQYMCTLDSSDMKKIDEALKRSFSITAFTA